MRPVQLFSAVLFLGFVFMFFLVAFFNSYVEPTATGTSPEGGLIYNLLHEEESKSFLVTGFEFHQKLPVSIKKKVRSLAGPSSLWLLQKKGASGTISIAGLQARPHSADHSVLVAVTYFISSEHHSGISVSGTGRNPETGQTEVQTERLSEAGVGEGTKSCYCKKLVYLGPVHEVKIEGHVEVDDAFVIIDAVQVTVGTTSLDKEEEMTCL